jgi:hypothetical protein
MGQVCSCGGAPAQGEVEVVTKSNSTSQPIPARVIATAEQDGIEAVPPKAPQGDGQVKTLIRAKTLIQQAKQASQGNLLRAAQRALESEDEEEASSEQWHDALDELQLEEVLSKWEEDQQATLARLERALQVSPGQPVRPALCQLAAAPLGRCAACHGLL